MYVKKEIREFIEKMPKKEKLTIYSNDTIFIATKDVSVGNINATFVYNQAN